jgi:hypothetical protein
MALSETGSLVTAQAGLAAEVASLGHFFPPLALLLGIGSFIYMSDIYFFLAFGGVRINKTKTRLGHVLITHQVRIVCTVTSVMTPTQPKCTASAYLVIDYSI